MKNKISISNIAIIHDQCLTMGGAERVFISIIKAFPDADIYTFAINYKLTHPALINKKIRTHPFGIIIRNHKHFKFLFPLVTVLMMLWNFKKYDLIITSSSTTAKYIKNFKGIHVCYCYTPTRAIWFSDNYFKKSSIGLKKFGLRIIIELLKKVDLFFINSVDHFIAISKITKRNILNIYKKPSKLIYSPINNNFFSKLEIKKPKDKYFLMISRLESEKNIDHVIDAFNKISKKLYIIGDGSEKEKLKSKSNANIIYLGVIDDKKLVNYLHLAHGLIFPSHLEYGLVPIEANALGVPVICYGKGGVTETMVFSKKDPKENTAIFYKFQTSESLLNALNKFEKITFNKNALRKNALRFSEERFIKEIRNHIKTII